MIIGSAPSDEGFFAGWSTSLWKIFVPGGCLLPALVVKPELASGFPISVMVGVFHRNYPQAVHNL